MSASVEDCIAMSDTGNWFAFPKTMKRGEVMHALARDIGWDEAIHGCTIRSGWIRKDAAQAYAEGESEWWAECEASTDGATPAWVVRA